MEVTPVVWIQSRLLLGNLRLRWHAGLRETWEDGRAFKELAQRRADVADAKEGIEAARKVRGQPLSPAHPLVHRSRAQTSWKVGCV